MNTPARPPRFSHALVQRTAAALMRASAPLAVGNYAARHGLLVDMTKAVRDRSGRVIGGKLLLEADSFEVAWRLLELAGAQRVEIQLRALGFLEETIDAEGCRRPCAAGPFCPF